MCEWMGSAVDDYGLRAHHAALVIGLERGRVG